MEAVQFDGKTIIVYLETLPNEKPIEMTSDILLKSNAKGKKIDTSDLSTYPFYSNKHYYSWKYCMEYGFKYRSVGYAKFVNLFFNRNEFSKFIQQSDPVNTENADDIYKHNIQIMMDLLLPTKMPTEYNFTDSLNEYIMTVGKSPISFKAQTSMLSNPIQFSYVSIKSKPYTVLKVTWLNDIVNNPIYRTFFDNFIKFNEWKRGAKTNTSEKINFLMNRLVKRLYVQSKAESDNDFMLNVNLKLTSDYKKIVSTVESINATKPVTAATQYSTAAKSEFNERVKDLSEQIESLYNITFITSDKSYIYSPPVTEEETNPSRVPTSSLPLANDLPFQKNFNGFDFVVEAINTDTIKKIYDISIAIEKNIKSIQSTQGGVLQITKDFISKVSNIVSMSKDAYILYQIFINYIGNDKVNTTLPKDDDILKELNENYPNVVSFISSITPISRSSRVSSNTKLQDIINKYVSNESPEEGDIGFDDLLNRCNVLFLQNKIQLDKNLSDSDRAKYMNTGVLELMNVKPNMPKYEIYIGLQLAEGEFTEPNQCLYREYFLGNKMENWFLTKSPYLEYKNRFILEKEDIDRYIKQSQQNEKSADIPIVNTISNFSSMFRNSVNGNPTTAKIADAVQNTVGNTVDTMVANTDKLISNITTNTDSSEGEKNTNPNAEKNTNANADKNTNPNADKNTNGDNVMKGGANRRTRVFLRPRRKRKTHKRTYQI